MWGPAMAKTKDESERCSRNGCGKVLQDDDWYDATSDNWKAMCNNGETKVCGDCMRRGKNYPDHFKRLDGRLT